MRLPIATALSALLLAGPVLAQPRPPPPGRPPAPGAPTPAPTPGKPAAPAPSAAGGKEITPGGRKGSANCEELRRKARYNIYFDKVEIEKLVQTVSDATCKTFILPENVRGKISIIGPENGKVEVDAEQFYAAFLAALDANSLALYQHGKFLKIVDKQRAKQYPIPTVLDGDEPPTTNEQMVTRLFKVKYVEIEALRGVLQQLVTPSGDTIPFQPDTIIINDLASNMKRLERLIDQLDSRNSSDEMRVVQLQFATAQDVADKINKLFETKGARPGQRAGVGPVPAPPQAVSAVPGAVGSPPAGTPGAPSAASGGPATLSQLIPDERTNKLIIIASPAAMDRIMALIREIDIPISGEGRINVYYLENAAAEEVASTLQSLAQGTANRPKIPGAPAGAPALPRPAGGGTNAAELFGGEVKVSADKATNSLVVIASQADYRSLVRVIEKLDIPRRQVFVEAVIMEVNLDRNADLGVEWHGGVPLKTADGQAMPVVFGTNYGGAAAPPSTSFGSLLGMSGFLAGIQGPVIPELAKLGINLPAFGVVLNALQSSSDVNVLSTPHLLTTDNEEAEITVGQNVPFQAGFSPGNVSGLTSAIPGASAALGGLSSGLGSLFAPITRQNVELKLTIKPQINESDYVRLVINEQIEEIASNDARLGPTTSKRTAKTTVVAKDQETVVIGGIMQDRTIEGAHKIPILGDIPILGHLFRTSNTHKVKTNLILFLTPYIIRDSSDFRRIFERKMKERQQFVEQFYGTIPGYEVAVDFGRKPGPAARLSQVIAKEASKLENGGPGVSGEKLIVPTGPVPVGGAAPAGGPQGSAPAPVQQIQMQEVQIKEPPAPTQPVERLEVQPGGDAR